MARGFCSPRYMGAGALDAENEEETPSHIRRIAPENREIFNDNRTNVFDARRVE